MKYLERVFRVQAEKENSKNAIFEYIEVIITVKDVIQKFGWMPPKKYRRLFNKISA
jgi:hypothetical protein